MNFFAVPSVSRRNLVFLFGVKLVAAALVWLIYTYHYQASDFYVYFTDSSKLLHNIFNSDKQIYSSVWSGSYENSWYNGSKAIIILNAFLQLFSFGNFYVHSVFFCFFSFAGLVALLKAFNKHFPEKRLIILTLFFIPSILFWGSAPLKESLIIGATGLFVYLCDFGLARNLSRFQCISVLFLLILIAAFKIYLLACLIPVLIVNAIVSRTSNKYLLVKYILVGCLTTTLLFVLSLFNPDYNVMKMLSNKQARSVSEARGGIFLVNSEHFICVDYAKADSLLESNGNNHFKIKTGSSYLSWPLENMSDTTFVTNSSDTAQYNLMYQIVPANTVLNTHKLKPDLRDFLIQSPMALFNSLIHPSFLEIHSWLHLLAALENMWILILILLAFVFIDKRTFIKKEILAFCFVYAFLLLLIIGFTTPVVGAIIRYRTIALLFLSTAFVILIDEEKLKSRLKRK